LNDGPSTLSEWRGKTEDEMEREDAAAIAAIPDAEVEDMLRTPLEARAVAALRERMARAEDGDEYEVYGEDEEEDEEKGGVGGVGVKGEAAPAATEPETAERPTRPKVAATTTTTPPPRPRPRPRPKPKPKPPATRKSTRRG
jgi:outer membrane biosynthesis protein TonB